MLSVADAAQRAAAKVDDPEMTYVDVEYVMGFVQDVYDWLFGKLRLTNNQFDEEVIVLPGVIAGLPTLDGYQATGNPLAGMVLPKTIRWKLPGQSIQYWRKADGPLDYPRDLNPGGAFLDSWAWIRYSVKLANFVTALDLEITGDFAFDPLTDPDAQITMTQLANRTFTCKLASEIGKARGNDKWVKTYGDDADEALDDLSIALSKENQKKTHRVGRMSRKGNAVGNTTITR
jgi:hypothetical protein